MDKRKKSKLGTLVMVGVFVYFVFTVVGQQKLIDAKKDEISKADSKVQEETRISKDLKHQKEIVNTDEYKEKVARDKLGMVKDGERIFMDVDN